MSPTRCPLMAAAGWLALLGLAGCAPQVRSRPAPAPAGPGQIRRMQIAYQANLLGEIEPCG